ncbi:unnamed protein product [Vitrella brassicaformis CCMP3155]|uniref:Uncharacterized protein n=2 Tax=Vitrella brassicaformis TaxID=1169539 RepID=A0A0G4H6Q3_VITBC|nr:unnamed protein product [Vitrella brassicaformis CCMP3155]|eukprot:CEM39360.1 unnamed protein product [Vitrella brassicaformis CCMP3155]
MVVEGHCEGQRAAAAAAGQPAGSTLESIEYSEFDSVMAIDDDEMRELQRISLKRESRPPPLDPPPTLASLTSITGIPWEDTGDPGPIQPVIPGRGRNWRLPSLEKVQTEWTVAGGELGDLVWASRSLKELQVKSYPDSMADSLRRIPVAAAGQPGPLLQLEDIGTLSFEGMDWPIYVTFDEWREGLEALQTVLFKRGCRSIKQFNAIIDLGGHPDGIDSDIFPTLSAIEAFIDTVCVSPDIPVDINISGSFDLGLLCNVPTRQSLFVQKHIPQIAATSESAHFLIYPEDLTNPGYLDTPSPADNALAGCLTFPKAKDVVVSHNNDVEDAEEIEVQPDPVVLERLPHNAFPAASRLHIKSRNGHAIARRLVTKMPAVKRIDLSRTHPTEEDAVRVLQAVGGERDLEKFEAGFVKGVGEGGLTWGDIADQLPTIAEVDISVEVPEELGDGDAAGEFGIACVKSLLKIRGIKQLTFRFAPGQAGGDSFKRLVEGRTHGTTIERLEGRYDISWGGLGEEAVTLKPLDT